jgi:multicomponent Na+:H+ antiporter subunit E
VRLVGRLVLLVALWLLAWGELSLANVLSGVAVAVGLLIAFPPGHRTGGHLRLRARGAARLALYVLVQLVVSNVVITRAILRPHPGVRQGILAHRLQHPSEEVATLMTTVIALSPGTMTVDVDEDSSTIYVHFLFLDDVAAARASLRRLEQLTARTLSAPAPGPTTTDRTTTARPPEDQP